MRKLLLILTIVLIAFTGILIWTTKDRTNQQSQLQEAQDTGQAQVGGDFTLTDQNGKIVKESEFRGRVMLVFFGFTNCPDICPVTVATLSKVMETLGDKGNKIAPVFITVDPERDTPEVIKNYLANFDSRIVGLTGTAEQVKAAAGAYKAYYAKSSDSHSHASAHEGHDSSQHAEGHYNVDHSGFIYLMDKDGKYVRLFPYDAPAQDILAALEPQL